MTSSLEHVARLVADARPFAPRDAGGRQPVVATPFVWVDPSTLPRREWIYGGHYVRRFLGVTIAPGGVGKSSLAIAEALAMASGRELIGVEPCDMVRVWYWNGEDPLDEMQRRVMAAAVHHRLQPGEFAGRLFVDSGRTTEIVIVEQVGSGLKIAIPIVEEIKRTIKANAIDVVIIDPFVSSHRVSENDNGAIDRVVKIWARIAEETGCAIELVHHSRKTNGAEVTVEDGRGAVALLAAARSGRVLNVMTEDEAERAGVAHRRLHFRVDNGKANMVPPPDGSTWYKLASVDLGNGILDEPGDNVGVVEAWAWPNPLDEVSVAHLRAAQKAVADGRWRENIQAKDWVGVPIARVLELDLTARDAREKVKALLKIWIANGMFVVVTGLDDKRNQRSFVEVGQWAND